MNNIQKIAKEIFADSNIIKKVEAAVDEWNKKHVNDQDDDMGSGSAISFGISFDGEYVDFEPALKKGKDIFERGKNIFNLKKSSLDSSSPIRNTESKMSIENPIDKED